MWVIRLSCEALFVLVLDWGLAGAWYAMVIDLVLRGLVTMLRFRSGAWKRLYPLHTTAS